MCGIVGYIGFQKSAPILLEGLRRLEYRGYDSAGVAVVEGTGIKVVRSVGKLVNLDEKLSGQTLEGSLGIGHTRWATHGRPSEENAHPHSVDNVVVVHNGIIENYLSLRAELAAAGHEFLSETDTEVIPHLISDFRKKGMGLENAVKAALGRLRGSYAVVAICADEPDKMVAARKASPLVVGVGEGETFVASDVPALLSHTRKFIFLEDDDIVVCGRDGYSVSNLKDGKVERTVQQISWSPAMAEKCGYKHFMLKEIFEQPRAITETLAGRLCPVEGVVSLADSEVSKKLCNEIKRLNIVACGTSYHAGLVGKYWIEALSRVPVEVSLASEFRYGKPILTPETGLLLISQSGETADTLAVLEEGRRHGSPILSICNVVGSSIARASDTVLYTHAGPEIGVASTKAFTTQLVVLYLLAIQLGNSRGVLDQKTVAEKIEELRAVPRAMEEALESDDLIKNAAKSIMDASSSLYLGRGYQYPIALEGALKLKEISYIHAEGYAAGEMKHGPIALVDDELPVVAVATKSETYEKMISNIEEIRARDGRIIAVATRGDRQIKDMAEFVLEVPDISEELLPMITTIPMQLLAYHVAVLKGTDVDQPRNLAKSVTVE